MRDETARALDALGGAVLDRGIVPVHVHDGRNVEVEVEIPRVRWWWRTARRAAEYDRAITVTRARLRRVYEFEQRLVTQRIGLARAHFAVSILPNGDVWVDVASCEDGDRAILAAAAGYVLGQGIA